MTAARKMDFEEQEPMELDKLLDFLSVPLSQTKEARLMRELSRHEPEVVLDRVPPTDVSSPFLLAALASVVAEWYRIGAKAAPDLLLNCLIKMTGSAFPEIVRVAATDALGTAGSRHEIVLRQLGKLVDDPCAPVRTSAEDALEGLLELADEQ